MAQSRFVRRFRQMRIDGADSLCSHRSPRGGIHRNLTPAGNLAPVSFFPSVESHGKVLPAGKRDKLRQRIRRNLRIRELVNLVEPHRHLLKCLLLTVFCVAASVTALAEQNGSRVTGAMLYHMYCASCHGDQARGNGMVGEALRTPPTDLTLLAHKNDGVFPDVRVRDYIEGVRDVTAHGPRTMPVWGMIFNDKETIRKIVDYLKELQRS